MPVIETIVATISALVAFFKSLPPDLQDKLKEIVSNLLERMLGDYYDWYRNSGGAPA